MENLCYLGALPLLLPHGLRSSPLNHRREVMYFLQRMFERHAPGTEMLISCGGMEVLGAFLDENYGSGREFVLVALEGIHYVLHMQVSLLSRLYLSLLFGS